MRVYVDVETTGLNPREDKVIEISAQLWDGPMRIDNFESLVNPGEELAKNYAEKLQKMTGITPKMLLEAPDEHKVSGEAHVKVMGWRKKDRKLTVHAFNNGFDTRFLYQEPWLWDRHAWGECVMLAAAKIVNPFDGRWPKLVAAAEHFGVKVDGRDHRAGCDVEKTALVHLAIMERRKKGMVL